MGKRFLAVLAVLAVFALVGAALWILVDPRGEGEGAPAAQLPASDDASAPRDPQLAGHPSDALTEPDPAAPAPGTPGADWKPVVVCISHYGLGKRLPGILVVAVDAAERRHEGRTGADGAFAFPRLAPGRARIEVVAPGWVSESIERLEVTADGAYEYLDLHPAVATKGRVLSAADGAPIADARVVAAAHMTVGHLNTVKKGDVWAVADSASDGRFHLDAVPLGDSFTLTVLKPGFARRIVEVTLHEAQAARQEIVVRLKTGGSLRGLVFDRSGGAVPRARVCVFPDGDEWLGICPLGSWSDGTRTAASLLAVTDAEGRFEVSGLALDARYAATAFARDYVRAKDADGLVASAEAPVITASLVLRDPGRVELVVRDEEGRPVVGGRATIGPWPLGFDGSTVDGVTDDQGRAVLGSLVPGAHRLLLRADGFLPATRDLELQEGESRRCELRLDRGAILSGVVVNEEGRPLARVHVNVVASGTNGSMSATAKTDAQGRFTIAGLEERSYRIDGGGGGYVFDPIDGVDAPAVDLRLVAMLLGVVKGRLVLPAGSPTPTRIIVGSFHDAGGGSSHQAWPTEPVEWYLKDEVRRLRVEGEGFAPWELEVRVEPGATRDLGEILLASGIDLAGRVVNPEGEPVPNAVLEASSLSFRTAQTDQRGRFELRHLPVGKLELELRAPGYLGRRIEMERDVSDRGLEFVLARGGVLRVRVLDGNGVPVVGRWVHVYPSDREEQEDDDEYWDRVTGDETSEQGRVELRLPPGAYRIEVDNGEGEAAEGAVVGEGEVREGGSKDVDVRAP